MRSAQRRANSRVGPRVGARAGRSRGSEGISPSGAAGRSGRPGQGRIPGPGPLANPGTYQIRPLVEAEEQHRAGPTSGRSRTRTVRAAMARSIWPSRQSSRKNTGMNRSTVAMETIPLHGDDRGDTRLGQAGAQRSHAGLAVAGRRLAGVARSGRGEHRRAGAAASSPRRSNQVPARPPVRGAVGRLEARGRIAISAQGPVGRRGRGCRTPRGAGRSGG